MTRKDIINYIVIAIVAITGCFIGDFFGGLITGFSTSILLFVTLGKQLAGKVESDINKKIHDQIQTRDNE